MTSTLWSLVELAARPLHRDEREAVLGDSLEAGDNVWETLFGVLGFVFRQQLLLWKSWRPWLAVFGLGLPSSYLLMVVSTSVTCTYDRLMGIKVGHWAPTGHEGFVLLVCHIFLLITWSWSAGYMVGAASRQTIWASAALSALPCWLFLCIPFYGPSFLLFLPPAILGVRRGWQGAPVSLRAAAVLALTMTVLMISAWSNEALWVVNWALLCPAWYLVATAWQSGPKGRTGFLPMGHAGVS
jgi:hypothetical protein